MWSAFMGITIPKGTSLCFQAGVMGYSPDICHIYLNNPELCTCDKEDKDRYEKQILKEMNE